MGLSSDYPVAQDLRAGTKRHPNLRIGEKRCPVCNLTKAGDRILSPRPSHQQALSVAAEAAGTVVPAKNRRPACSASSGQRGWQAQKRWLQPVASGRASRRKAARRTATAAKKAIGCFIFSSVRSVVGSSDALFVATGPRGLPTGSTPGRSSNLGLPVSSEQE